MQTLEFVGKQTDKQIDKQTRKTHWKRFIELTLSYCLMLCLEYRPDVFCVNVTNTFDDQVGKPKPNSIYYLHFIKFRFNL